MADPRNESLEARVARLEKTVAAHSFLLQALLTHLAVTSPQAFGALIGGFANSKLYGMDTPSGALTREVAEQLTSMLEDIAASLRR